MMALAGGVAGLTATIIPIIREASKKKPKKRKSQQKRFDLDAEDKFDFKMAWIVLLFLIGGCSGLFFERTRPFALLFYFAAAVTNTFAFLKMHRSPTREELFRLVLFLVIPIWQAFFIEGMILDLRQKDFVMTQEKMDERLTRVIDTITKGLPTNIISSIQNENTNATPKTIEGTHTNTNTVKNGVISSGEPKS